MSTSLAPGAWIGPYEIIEPLGSGSIGTVYKARDLRLERVVALKVLSHTGDWGEDAMGILRRESRATASVSHPNILQVYALDEIEGQFYLTREFVDGESLAAVLGLGPLPERDALTVAASVCRALNAAHAHQLIHRDIKPSNVLIPHGDRFDRAKLADFGLAGMLGARSGVTRVGEIFGTPLYMSPEQLRGDRQSASSDLYGLGVLLYEMLYGRTPFNAQDLRTLAVQVLTVEVTFPPVPVVSPGTRELLSQLLGKRPDDRPPAAAVVLAKLDSLLDKRELVSPGDRTMIVEPGRPLATKPSIAAPRDGTMRPWVVAACVALVAAVVGSLLVLSGGPNLPSVPPSTESPLPPHTLSTLVTLLLGVAVGVIGVVLAMWVSRSLQGLRPTVADHATRILLGAERRELLTASLALDVDTFVSRCKGLDQRILGRSLALVVDQLQHANTPGDQRELLPLVVSMTTHLSERLLPWYVRYEKVLAFFVAALGLATGIVTIVQALR